MEIFKKSVILSPVNYDGKSIEKGILTLQKDGDNINGLLKCFNMNTLNGKILLGITFGDNKVHKFNLKENNLACFNFSFKEKVNLSNIISCVLVHVDNNQNTPLIWGSTNTNKIHKLDILNKLAEEEAIEIIQSFESDFKETDNFEVNNKKVKKQEAEETLLDDETEKFIDNEFKKEQVGEFFSDNSQTKKQMNDFKPYEEMFFTKKETKVLSPNKLQEMEDDEENKYEKGEEQTELTFYEQVKEQIDALFLQYEREEALEQIIPHSTFVRVDFNNDGESYIFGVIYDENSKPEYIVYGIPTSFHKEPPKELEGYYQWLPLDTEKPEEDGYYMMYQDARTGEHVKVEVI